MLSRLLKRSRFLRDTRGVAMIEFAFVAPVILMMTIGAIDVGRLVWTSSMLDHMAREATRMASVRGADSIAPVTKTDIENFVSNRIIGVKASDVTVTVNWTPNNNPGGTVTVQLDYQYTYLLRGLITALDPISLQGESAMVVL